MLRIQRRKMIQNPFEAALAFTLEQECGPRWQEDGGYTNDRHDAGGETKYGISKRAHPTVNIKDLTIGRASKIYYDQYWMPHNYNLLPAEVAVCVWDFGVNSGPARAKKILQKMVGATDDGKIGPRTKELVQKAVRARRGADMLARDYNKERLRFLVNLYKNNPKKHGRYMRGWINRIIDLTAYAA